MTTRHSSVCQHGYSTEIIHLLELGTMSYFWTVANIMGNPFNKAFYVGPKEFLYRVCNILILNNFVS
ncbi:hypothetical protein MtrunA17_Chr5g0436351 [Medicago truncatula]|uniref:Uncharacterized protein n=1 Tax=Medicago truncatula TaxID=3880 RepID=I3T2Q2_MEDTR|nr:unknown [Medicago truncatula]RHN57065.1 hypothetical protein MtrunA17_Chr5g0436351 [Medicago truncatula]